MCVPSLQNSRSSYWINFYRSGKVLPLLSVVKLLFNHVSDVLSNVPSFQSEYGVILRHLLAVRDYHFHMRKRIYSSEFLL